MGIFAIDREIETYRLDALESTQALEPSRAVKGSSGVSN
jgi:hypothetical protein